MRLAQKIVLKLLAISTPLTEIGILKVLNGLGFASSTFKHFELRNKSCIEDSDDFFVESDIQR